MVWCRGAHQGSPEPAPTLARAEREIDRDRESERDVAIDRRLGSVGQAHGAHEWHAAPERRSVPSGLARWNRQARGSDVATSPCCHRGQSRQVRAGYGGIGKGCAHRAAVAPWRRGRCQVGVGD
jgi:hypothetical protein